MRANEKKPLFELKKKKLPGGVRKGGGLQKQGCVFGGLCVSVNVAEKMCAGANNTAAVKQHTHTQNGRFHLWGGQGHAGLLMGEHVALMCRELTQW